MKRVLTWMSLVMLVATLLFWAVAAYTARDFRSIGEGDRFRHLASMPCGNSRVTWVLDRRLLLFAAVSAGPGSKSPMLEEREPVNAMLSGKWKWHGQPTISTVVPFAVRMSTFESDPSDGPVVTLRLIYSPLWLLAALFALLPSLAASIRLLRLGKRQVRAFHVARVRRARLNLGRCQCGYDLRSSRGRCPECGSVIRWVPTKVPSLR